MWLRRLLDALHGCHGVGNGAGIDLEAQVARWPSASCGSSLLRCALTGPRGACAEQVLRVPKASIWTLLGVVSMQPVQQHCLARAERASIAWSSAESSHFALTVAVAVLPSWFWSIFSNCMGRWEVISATQTRGYSSQEVCGACCVDVICVVAHFSH